MNTPVATSPTKPSLLQQFQDSLKAGDVAGALAEGLIGKDAVIEGPFGVKPLVYADYVASGRALMQVERFV
ncbi:MAG: aminotransferase, partial [Achromobacter sp.]